MRLTTEEFWNNSYHKVKFSDQRHHSVSLLIDKYLPDVENKTAIELGSFPGAFLPTIGRKGFLVNGIDFNDRNSTDLPKWLNSVGIRTGQFVSGDLFELQTTQKFDLVCSFGLIEHFENYEDVIKLHAKLVSASGSIVITTPNFRGFLQYIPHLLFDKKNLDKHFLPSMNPQKWKELLSKMGYEIRYSGYFGGYIFWVDNLEKRGRFNKFCLRLVRISIGVLNKLFKTFNIESQLFSAYCGVIAVKK